MDEMARAKQPPRGTPKEEVSVEAAVPPTEAETQDEALGSGLAENVEAVEDVAPVAPEVPAPSENPEPVVARAAVEEARESPEIREELLPVVPTTLKPQATHFQSIVAEATNYSTKSSENAAAFVKKLLGARSFASVVRIQSDYAETSYTDLVAYLTKVARIYSKLATETFQHRSHIA
jgi:hypothetical protein